MAPSSKIARHFLKSSLYSYRALALEKHDTAALVAGREELARVIELDRRDDIG